MKKIVKKYGNSLVIRFDPEELKIYDFTEGDVVDIEIVKVKKEENKNVRTKKN